MSASAIDIPLYSAKTDAAIRRESRWRPIALPLLTAVFAIATWELICRVLAVPVITMPAPSDIVSLLIKGYAVILPHAIPTITEAAAGFAIATLLGLALAVAITLSSVVKQAIFPNLVVIQLTPKIALAPLFIVWFGIGSESRLAYATFIAFFPIMISTITGLSNAPPDLVRFARSIPASEWQIFRTIRIPVALPYIFSSLKIAVTMSTIGIIVGEFITSQRGLGYLILFASSKADTPLIFAAVTCLSVGGLSLFGIVALAERLVLARYQQR